MYPLVRELAVDGIPVAVTCRVLKIARQPYYRWLANPVTDAELTRPTVPTRCSTLTATTLSSVAGSWSMRPSKLASRWPSGRRGGSCSELGWWSSHGKKRGGNGKKPGPPVHDDLCAVTDKHGATRHEFKADGPNELWLSDITEQWTGEGKLYVCAIKDVYSDRIVGYSIDSRMKSSLAVAALNNAAARRGDVAGRTPDPLTRRHHARRARCRHASWPDERRGVPHALPLVSASTGAMTLRPSR